jgi:DNA-binding transcriptional LysR family regulator
MELRHLETLIAIDEEGTFTAAADSMRTVQSNVSAQVRQLEAELEVTLLARGRGGATPTEAGRAVIARARRVRRELELLQEDLAALQGLRVGSASLGIVGTASRWLVPQLVAALREEAPGVRLRVNEGASERLLAEVLDQGLAQAVVTEPVRHDHLLLEHLMEEALVGLAPVGTELPSGRVPFAALAKMPLMLPPTGNPLRSEIEDAARAHGVQLDVRVEVEGIRLIADLVASGAGVSVLPETAIPPELAHLPTFAIAQLPPRRLGLVTQKGVPLSLADRAVRETVLRIVTADGVWRRERARERARDRTKNR